MEPYIPLLMVLLGGSGIAFTAVSAWLNRRRSGLDADGIRDDQTAKWRDNALQLSDDVIQKNRKVMDLESELHSCLRKLNSCGKGE